MARNYSKSFKYPEADDRGGVRKVTAGGGRTDGEARRGVRVPRNGWRKIGLR